MIRHAARAMGAVPGESASSPFDSLVRIEPTAAAGAIAAEVAVGNFAAAVALSKARPFTWPEPKAGIEGALVERDGMPLALANGISPALDLAYAYAAIGDVAAARHLTGEVRTRLAAFAAGVKTEGASEVLLEAVAGPQLRLIEARVALAEGTKPAALTGDVPSNAAAVEYFTALRNAGAPAPEVAPLEKQLAQGRKANLARLADTVLIAPETRRAVIDYEKSRPNILGALIGGALSMGTSLLGGIDRTAGFRSTDNPDGTVKVEFTGSTTSGPMVQEMTLLRAAELAKDAGKSRFAVESRKDYARYMVTTQYGAEISRVPSGYKSEIVVRFAGADAPAAATLDAGAVIDALGPLYYSG